MRCVAGKRVTPQYVGKGIVFYPTPNSERSLKDLMTEWIISDTHFGHYNIIDYCSRPFDSVTQMDRAMIARWKGTVGDKDIIYHLGDVGLSNGRYDLSTVISQLPGRKILIRGNHDKNPESMRQVGFDVVWEEGMVRCDGVDFRLIHKPQTTQGYGDYILHGHIHNSTPETRKEHEHKGELVHIPPFNINMSVELWNYTPVSLRWLVKELARRKRIKS